jgi:hypothetical protein
MISLIFTLSAVAASFTCDFPAVKIPASAKVVWEGNGDNSLPLVTSELTVESEEVPAVTATCFYQDVPGHRGFRCTHRNSAASFDLYPKFQEGVLVKLHMVKWDPRESVKSFFTEDCRSLDF